MTAGAYTFRVRGRGAFPFDMLRYDECNALNEAEGKKLAGWFDTYLHNRHEVTLTGDKRPTVARWESFGWTVLWEDPDPTLDLAPFRSAGVGELVEVRDRLLLGPMDLSEQAKLAERLGHVIENLA